MEKTLLKKIVLSILGAVLLLLTGFLSQSHAEVGVSVGIAVPAYTFSAPLPVVVIPGTYAYFVPDIDVDVMFYHGYWYRPYDGRWFRARGFNGPWACLAPAKVPRVLIELPMDYRHIYPGRRLILYGEFHKNWRRWERDRYWDGYGHWRKGIREEHGERLRHG